MLQNMSMGIIISYNMLNILGYKWGIYFNSHYLKISYFGAAPTLVLFVKQLFPDIQFIRYP